MDKDTLKMSILELIILKILSEDTQLEYCAILKKANSVEKLPFKIISDDLFLALCFLLIDKTIDSNNRVFSINNKGQKQLNTIKNKFKEYWGE